MYFLYYTLKKTRIELNFQFILTKCIQDASKQSLFNLEKRHSLRGNA